MEGIFSLSWKRLKDFPKGRKLDRTHSENRMRSTISFFFPQGNTDQKQQKEEKSQY